MVDLAKQNGSQVILDITDIANLSDARIFSPADLRQTWKPIISDRGLYSRKSQHTHSELHTLTHTPTPKLPVALEYSFFTTMVQFQLSISIAVYVEFPEENTIAP